MSRVLGLDWGPASKLLTGVVIDGGVSSSGVSSSGGDVPYIIGKPGFFRAGLIIRDHSRRREAELLRAKADRIDELLAGRGDGDLSAKAAAHRTLALLIHRARRRSNKELARLGALWAVTQAIATGCDTIAMESLGTLQAGGRGRRTNVSVATSVKGQLEGALRSACAKAGLRLVLVNPAHTSQSCHSCGGQLAFSTSPALTTPGHRWAYCAHCGMSADRDVNAATNVGVRALRTRTPTSQHSPRPDTRRSTRPLPTPRPTRDLGGVGVHRTRTPRRPLAPPTSSTQSPRRSTNQRASRTSSGHLSVRNGVRPGVLTSHQASPVQRHVGIGARTGTDSGTAHTEVACNLTQPGSRPVHPPAHQCESTPARPDR
jgi:hypothetical protein